MYKWLPKIVQEKLFVETTATCHDCVMTKASNPLNTRPYEPSLKCCTFHPFTPNFAIGAILSDSRVKGQGAVKQLIHELKYALPIGLVAPPWYQHLFANKGKIVFGRSSEMLCPFFDSNQLNCGIWQHRGSECRGFHCVSDHGDKGDNFWIHVKEYLYAVEMHLSQMAMLEKGYAWKEVEENLKWIRLSDTEKFSGKSRLTSNEAQEIWAHHFLNMEKYYLKCHKFVEQYPVETLKTDIENGRGDVYLQMLNAAAKLPKNQS